MSDTETKLILIRALSDHRKEVHEDMKELIRLEFKPLAEDVADLNRTIYGANGSPGLEMKHNTLKTRAATIGGILGLVYTSTMAYFGFR